MNDEKLQAWRERRAAGHARAQFPKGSVGAWCAEASPAYGDFLAGMAAQDEVSRLLGRIEALHDAQDVIFRESFQCNVDDAVEQLRALLDGRGE